MRLTLDLPASLRDLARFAALADDLGVDDTTVPACDGDALVLDLSERTDEPEPEPVKPPRADKRAAKKVEAPAKRKRASGRPTQIGDNAIAVLSHLVDIGGTFDGRGATLLRAALRVNNLTSNHSTTLTNLADRGHIEMVKANPTTVTAVKITAKGRQALAEATGDTRTLDALRTHPAKTASNVGTVTPLPSKPRQVPQLPEGGLREPRGGWA